MRRRKLTAERRARARHNRLGVGQLSEDEGTLICEICRKPGELVALYANGGYANAPRPAHVECYEKSRYHQIRFRKAPLPGAAWWLDSWREKR